MSLYGVLSASLTIYRRPSFAHFGGGGGGSVLRWTVAGQKYGPQGLRNSIMGAFIIRIGFWAHYAIIIVRNPQSGIGNHGGPYITAS